MEKRILRPDRLRRVPAQFSWVDQRLVREGYTARVGVEGLALYLFLVTVGDADGVSYYGDAALMRQLLIDGGTLARARKVLLAAGLIAYERPLYQVLALGRGAVAPAVQRSRGGELCSVESVLRQAMLGRRAND